ncbi:hypothetical protein M758_1G144800 [Ceratodon purpureus]|nr:hypothetical protein M758_1G144800 [Ceratodon purpureus]
MRIVCWNVNGLYTTLKDAAARHTSASNYFSQVLKADIVCFQEAKVQEEKLEKWMACVEGYDSHWAFSQAKKGYSGVVTYVKEEFSPLDAKADWLGESTSSSTEDLCKEGRLICTDHGSFVLLNVYVPNAGDHDEGRPRLDFKLRYLKALEQTCDELVRSGKHVMIVGDFNIAHKDIDVHARWKVEEIYSLEEREWLDGFLSKYVDLYRHFHPDEKDVYSVWNQKTEARIHNEGLRIDYSICDKGFLTEVLEADIVKMQKQWSDHAALVVVLKEQAILPPHPAPALSSRNMKRFNEDPRQKKLTALFNKGLKRPTAAVEPDKKPEVKSEEVNPKSELASASVSEVVNSSQKDITKESDPPVCEEHTNLVQPAESPGTKATLSTIANCDEVLHVGNTIQGPPENVNRTVNNETTINNSKSPSKKNNSVSQSKGKGQTLAGKRKAESDSKGSNTKQRSVSSFFKPATAK